MNNPRSVKSKNNKPVGREGQKTIGLYKKINMTDPESKAHHLKRLSQARGSLNS
jgi:hypothetical protein